jgi:hypothetical protein
MGFKETKAYFENCISRSALVCPFGFAAGRNKLCVCVCTEAETAPCGKS